MGHVFNFKDAERYDEWFLREPGRTVFALEKELLYRVWFPLSAQRVLDVGCGTGLFSEWLAQLGHQVTGLDPSPPMLRVARQRLPLRVRLDNGHAEDLPYENNAFDMVALITTLEFVDDAAQALQEAFRVARNHVLLGVLNKYSLTTLKRYAECLWRSSVYRHARFFSVFELWRLAEKILDGRVPVRWHTTLSLPLCLLPYSYNLENSRYFQWHPFGHFIAMRIDLQYRFYTLQDPLLAAPPSHVKHVVHIPRWRSNPRPQASSSFPLLEGGETGREVVPTALGCPSEPLHLTEFRGYRPSAG